METILLQIEKKRRNGKTVTVLKGFTRDRVYLEELAAKIKKACGVGGTLRSGSLEIQGDSRAAIRGILEKEGFEVRG